MKAEHRKELQTNELADWLGRTAENVKSANRMHMLLGLLAVVLACLIGWWAWQVFSRDTVSGQLMMKVQAAGDNTKELEKIIDENRGTMAARTARFDLARIYYQEGIRDFTSPDLRVSAITKLI